MPQLNTYVQQRLGKWAIWIHWGSSGKPAHVVSWYEKVVMAPNVQGRGHENEYCPVNEVEALDTHKCIASLPPYLRDTIREEYTRAGTVDMKARQLGIQRRTYYDRLDLAYTKLLDYMNCTAANIPLPIPEPDPKRVKKANGKKGLTLPHSSYTFHATVA
jgi:hypothetical protein